jgi:lipopolysaccharide/colanic/teichoic acid biosynthesis glycosyltransferase
MSSMPTSAASKTGCRRLGSVAPRRPTHVAPSDADSWIRDEVKALLRGDEVRRHAYDTAVPLNDELAVFRARQEAYATSIESGVRQLDRLARAGDEERTWSPSTGSVAVKRVFDVTVAAVTLVVVAPLLAVIAIAIKLDSRGPVLFRQTRLGQNDRTFTLLKFRTMQADAGARRAALQALTPSTEAGGLFKIQEDPRITPIGRRLRCWGLDELPQLLNVIKGDMSLVGPRPLIVEEAVRIRDREQRPSRALKPGMTGVAQLHPHAAMTEALRLEDEYAKHRSLATDAALLGRTLLDRLTRRHLL